MLPTLLLPALAALLPAPPVQDDRVDAWGEDLIFLYEKLQEMHPDPFAGTPREEFEAALEEIYRRLPELTDDQVIVELMRFVALVSREGHDGHTHLWPLATFHYLPLRLYRFADGWFVVSAKDETLVGAQVLAVGDTPIEEVCERIAPLLTKDSEATLPGRLALPLLMPELHHALGITPERQRTGLRLRTGAGQTREVALDGLSFAEYSAWAGAPPPLVPPVEGALWLSNADATWWTKVLPEDEALYVQYNVVAASDPDGGSIGDLGAAIVRTFQEQGLERVVVDVRLNGGGDNTTFGPLIEALRGCERLNTRGRLYLLIGRHTFSAAGNFVAVFERDLNSILVGEPAGGGPNQYGDSRDVTLPHHPELSLEISTRWHEFSPGDPRLTTEPDLTVVPTAADYFAGRDPVLRTALDHAE